MMRRRLMLVTFGIATMWFLLSSRVGETEHAIMEPIRAESVQPKASAPQVVKPKVAIGVYVHRGNYARTFTGYEEGTFDNIAIQTAQVHRFAPQMKYDVQLMAFLDNTSMSMAPMFTRLGWHVRELALPIDYSDVRNAKISHELRKDGAIGLWEILKLEVWRPSVVGIDVDMVLLVDTDIHFRQPFDSVFDTMAPNATLGFTQGAWEGEKMNGGFLVIRPNAQSERDYHAILEVLKEGDFRSGRGWRGKVGWTYGGRTIQGLLPYYYLHDDGKGRATNLSRCLYNNMVSSPACRAMPADRIVSNHFTGECTKPWACGYGKDRLCRALVDAWWDDSRYAEKWLGLPQRARCGLGGYKAMGINRSSVTLPPR